MVITETHVSYAWLRIYLGHFGLKAYLTFLRQIKLCTLNMMCGVQWMNGKIECWIVENTVMLFFIYNMSFNSFCTLVQS